MDKNQERIADIISRFLHHEISDEEMNELRALQKEYPQIKSWIECKDEKLLEIRKRYDAFQAEQIMADWHQIETKIDNSKKQRIKWWMAAASAITLVFFTLWWLQKVPDVHETFTSDQSDSSQIVPGTEKAYLTLSDGSTVTLGKSGSQIIRDEELELNAGDKGLSYSGISERRIYMHKLKVPAGGTYHIQLSDGTKVWINADSEMEFPSAFNGKERKIILHGEGYFEVAKDASKPFRVVVDGTTIEAIGTAFNINSHRKEGFVKTILTEGKIKVSNKGAEDIINAGYATISGNGKIDIEKADIEEALAWKDGYFYFTEKNIDEILGDVSRWYNINLKIESSLSSEKYHGGIKRTESILKVCKMLEELSGHTLTLQNKTLIVK